MAEHSDEEGPPPSPPAPRKAEDEDEDEFDFMELLEQDKGIFDEAVIEKIEGEFQRLHYDLEGDPSCEPMAERVEKLCTYLRKFYDEGRILTNKLEDAMAELELKAKRLSDAAHVQTDDQLTISTLRTEIERAWKQGEDHQEAEQKMKEVIHSLESELDNMQNIFRMVPILAAGPEAVLELQKTRDDLLLEKDTLMVDLNKLRENEVDLTAALQEAEKKVETCEASFKELAQDNFKKRTELQRETRKREKLELDQKTLKAEVDSRQDIITNLQQQIVKLKEGMATVEQNYKSSKVQRDQLVKEMEGFNLRVLRLQQDAATLQVQIDHLNAENGKLLLESKSKDEDLVQTKLLIAKLTKERDGLTKKMNIMEIQRADLEQTCDHMKSQITAMQREIDGARRDIEQHKRTQEDLAKEKENTNKNYVNATMATRKQVTMVKHLAQLKKGLDSEILTYRDQMEKQKQVIQSMTKDKERNLSHISELTKKISTLMGEIKSKELQTYEVKKYLMETQTKLRQQYNMYDAVRSDRNMFSKNLIETQDEVSEMRRKVKLLSHQIEQLKDEVSLKEASLAREQLVSQKLEREKEAVKKERSGLRDQLTSAQANFDTLKGEETKLQHIVAMADKTKEKKDKLMGKIRTERDLLAYQLLRKTTELRLIHEKLQIHQLTLKNGETEYQRRLDDLRLLKLEVHKLRREKQLLCKSYEKMDEVRREVYRVQRELTRERTRCRALEDEMENPINVHRWRKLQGTDPSTYELVQKVHTLQRRLIARTEQVVEKEVLIQEKDQLYNELKVVLARQPRQDVADQIMIYHKTLRDKNRQMKCMVAELNMYEQKASESEGEIRRLVTELQDVKKKLYEYKRKDILLRDRPQTEVPLSLRERTITPLQTSRQPRRTLLATELPPLVVS